MLPLRAVPLCLAALLAALLAVPSTGQEPERPTQDPEPITTAAIDELRALVEAEGALSPEEQQSAAAWLDEARTMVERARAARSREQAIHAEIEAAPRASSTARVGLALPDREAVRPSAAAPIAELEADLAAARQRVEQAANERAQLEARASSLAERRASFPDRVAAVRRSLEEVTTQLATPADESIPPLVRQARSLRLRAQDQALRAELAEIEAESSANATLTEVAQLRAQLAQRRATELAADVAALEKALDDQRVREAIRLRESVRDAVRSAPEALAPYADEVRAAADQTQAAVNELRETQARRKQAEARHAALAARFAEIQNRITIVGLSEAMGLELRRVRREQLADLDTLRREAKLRRAQLNALYEKSFAAEDALAAIDDGTVSADVVVAEHVPAASGQQRNELVAAAQTLVERRRTVLRALNDAYDALIPELQALDVAETQLRTLATQAADYVDERVLWIASAPPFWHPDFDAFVLAAEGLSATWVVAAEDLIGALEDPASIVLLAAALALGLLRRPLRRALRVAGEVAARRTTVRMTPTFKAIAWTVLLALPIPLVLIAAQVHLIRHAESPAIAEALGDTAVVGLALLVLWETCRPYGLGVGHFEWQAGSAIRVRRHLRWLAPLIAVCTFVASSIEAQPHDEWRGVLGRWMLVVPLVALAWFLRELVRRDRGVFLGSGAWERIGAPIRWLLATTLVALPLALAGLALAGYAFTANVLYARLLDTLLLLFAVVLGRSIVMRWLLLARRQIVIKNTRERLRVAQQAAAAGGGEATLDVSKVEAEALDLAAVDQATRRLARVAVYVVLAIGAWGIWVDVLPAMRLLENVPLWYETIQVSETVVTDGVESTRTVERLDPVSLADVLGALLLVILTWIAARNVPGLLEIAVLQKTRLRAGERYAINSIARYTIVLVGGLAAFSALGIRWSQVQWLVAGVSVGLGFGLQEIFANFVSGVILLFERPIRVGDYVTVSGTDGIVTRIQMRATTVRDWNRHELVIPNKEFVTQQVVNWSLSDTIVRLVVPVGVAYGSDPGRVRELLTGAAKSVSVVVADPEPTAVFRGFGDNALNFELRAFIASMDDWLTGMNGLHDAIARNLGDAGIEIAFPQRDLHVRTIGPLKEILAASPRAAEDAVR